MNDIESDSQVSSSGSTAAPPPMRVHFDVFELDEANARLLHRGEPVALPPTPLAVLCALARQPGELISKHALLDAVWGDRFVSDSVLKTAISELRAALGDDARHPRYIETVPRRGYRFIGSTGALEDVPVPDARGPVRAISEAPPITCATDALARLHAAWARTSAGRNTVFWVEGDPGVGKAKLIDDFVASLGNVAVARSQCIGQEGAAEPFFPVLEALTDLCRVDAGALRLLRAMAPALLLQAPLGVGTGKPDTLRLETGVHPSRTLRTLAEFFDRYTERSPLLLVTQDLHRSDYATIQLIDHVARGRGEGRLMWAASFPTGAMLAGDHPLRKLRSELRFHGLCEEIVLDSISGT